MHQETCLPHSLPERSLPSLAGRTHRWRDRKRRQEFKFPSRVPRPELTPLFPKEPERIHPEEKTSETGYSRRATIATPLRELPSVETERLPKLLGQRWGLKLPREPEETWRDGRRLEAWP